MDTVNKTYKYISAFTLMLFLSSIVLPASLSAASLFCGMDMAAMNGGTHDCCNFHEAGTKPHDETKMESDNKPCSPQQMCPYILSKEQADVQAIPQLSKGFTAVFVYKDLPDGLSSLPHSATFQTEPVTPDSHPPLFLLNSAFLN